jgi:hypothetical protein
LVLENLKKKDMTLKETIQDIEIGKGMSDKLEQIADEFAIGFGHFLAEHTYSCYENGWSNDFGHKELTTKELLEIYKKEKGL